MNHHGLKARLRAHRPGGFQLDVALTLPARGITVLHGPSGAGKSTCLRLIAGLEQASDSRICFSDTIWQDQTTFVPAHHRAIGYVFQEARLFPHLNVAQNLDYGRRRRDRQGKVDRAHLIDLLGIAHLLDRAPATLSGGERQRVAIARALLSAPRLLLMDEPLASVDSARKDEFLSYLDRLHAELAIPVIYVTHSAEERNRLADHTVQINAGRIIESPP